MSDTEFPPIGPAVIDVSVEAPGYREPPQTVKDQAWNAYAAVYNSLVGELHASPWVGTLVGGISFALVLLVGYILGPVVAIIATIGGEFATVLIETLDQVRKADNPVLENLTNAVLGEFFGWDFGSVASLKRSGRNVIERADEHGGKVLELFELELVGSPPQGRPPGFARAARWLGFNVDFSIYTALLSVIAEIASFNYAVEMRELGANVARNLGLGRMTRQVLMPLIKVGVQIPYTEELNARYRPTLLNATEYAQGLLAGLYTEQQYLNRMARHGYTDADAGVMLELHRKKITPAELERLMRWGVITQEQAIAEIRKDFYSEATANLILTAQSISRLDQLERQLADYWETLLLHQVIDHDTYAALLDQLHWTDAEKRAQLALTGNKLEYPRKFLTLSEAEYAFQHDLMAIDEFMDFLRDEGYSPDDVQLLTLINLYRKGLYDQAAAVKDARCRAQWAKYRQKVAEAEAKGQDPSTIVPPACPEPPA